MEVEATTVRLGVGVRRWLSCRAEEVERGCWVTEVNLHLEGSRAGAADGGWYSLFRRDG